MGPEGHWKSSYRPLDRGLTVSTAGRGVQPPSRLSPFQSRCAVEVERLLGENDLSFDRQYVMGREESYLVFEVETTGTLKIYVYDDEAGFFLGKRWHIWEAPDYEESQELLDAFLDGLRSAIKKSV